MTSAQWIKKALDEAGGKSLNTIFEIAFIFGTAGGVFPVHFNGFTSDPIAYPPSALELKAALESLPTIKVGGCKVAGPIGGPFEVEMIGDNAGQNLPPLVVDGSDLQPAQEVEVTPLQSGENNDYSTTAETSWADHADDSKSDKERFLRVKVDLLELRINAVSDQVDQRTGAANVTESKNSQRVAALERQLERVNVALSAEIKAQAAGARRSYGAIMTHKTPSGKPYGQMRD